MFWSRKRDRGQPRARLRVERLEDRQVPTTLFGLNATGTQLLAFDTATPGTIDRVLTVTGLRAGEVLVGIDFRPATGDLVGVGQFGATGQVYTINTQTGAATPIGAGIPALTGTQFGVDFNPVPNALRIVSDAEQNLRVVAGGAGAVNTDTALTQAGVAAATLNAVGAAYSDNVPGGTGGATTLFLIDTNQDVLLVQGSRNFPAGGNVSPNTGILTPVGPLGVDATALLGFDVSASDGTALAALQVGGQSQLFQINLATGAATSLGTIGDGSPIRGLSFPAGVIQIATPAVAVSEAGNFAVVALTRTLGTSGAVTVTVTASSGTAVAGQDFFASSTTVTFNEGETVKTAVIRLRDDVFVEGNETFVVRLGQPAGGVRLGAAQAATVTILDDNDAAITDANQRFVDQVFLDLLGRRTDPAGLAAALSALTLPNGRDLVVSAVLQSPEFAARQVELLYNQILGRASDPAGLNNAVAQFRQGVSLDRLRAAFFGSDEYFRVKGGGNNTSFLQQLYRDVLGREIDASGLGSFTIFLNRGVPRSAVAFAILTSLEADQATTVSLYNSFLRRVPDPSGFNSVVTLLQRGADETVVIQGFLASVEFFGLTTLPPTRAA